MISEIQALVDTCTKYKGFKGKHQSKTKTKEHTIVTNTGNNHQCAIDPFQQIVAVAAVVVVGMLPRNTNTTLP